MIGWGRRHQPAKGPIETLVGRNTQVSGDMVFFGVLHCDGRIQGDVRAEEDTESMLTLSAQGAIHGDVRAPYLRIDGQVIGDVYASQRIELGPHARIEGDVHYTLLEMAVGAEVNGRLRHVSESRGRDPLALPSQAENLARLTTVPLSSPEE